MSQPPFLSLEEDTQRQIRHWATMLRFPDQKPEQREYIRAMLTASCLKAANLDFPELAQFPEHMHDGTALLAAYDAALEQAQAIRADSIRGKDRHAHRNDPLTPIERADSYAKTALMLAAVVEHQRDMSHATNAEPVGEAIGYDAPYLRKEWRRSPEWLALSGSARPDVSQLTKLAYEWVVMTQTDAEPETAARKREEYFGMVFNVMGYPKTEPTKRPTPPGKLETMNDAQIMDFAMAFRSAAYPVSSQIAQLIDGTEPAAATDEQRKLMAYCGAPLQAAYDRFKTETLGKSLGKQ